MFNVVEVVTTDDEGGVIYGEDIALAPSLEDAQEEAKNHMLSEPWTFGYEILELVNTGSQKVWIPVEQI